MSVVPEGIKTEGNALSFGNYQVKEKIKVNDYEFMGNIYRLRSHDKVTRLEKNGELLMETVPGAAIGGFEMDDKCTVFAVDCPEDCQITLGLEPEKEYRLTIGGEMHGEVKASRAGKLSFGVQSSDGDQAVRLDKLD